VRHNTHDWLLVVDMQPAFGSPDSPWFVPRYEACAENVARLVDAFRDRVVFTRFVPPTDPQGSWRRYYETHSFALDPRHKALWTLDPRWSGSPSVASHRFAKWHEAAAHIPDDAVVVLCGVATDCCVLGTALEANDAGRHIRLVADACAAGTEILHNAALTVCSDRSDQLQIIDTAQELGRT